MYNSIQFPPGTVSSKLSSKLLKKPPSPIDWVHQSYMEMIQDVSYTTSHYYESKDNGSSIMEASVPELTKHDRKQDETNNLNNSSSSSCEFSQQSATAASTTTPPLSLQRLFDSTSTPLSSSSSEYQKDRLKQVQEEENATTDDDDDDDDEFNTITTSSTDCNRKNNIYRFYKEQQSLARPIDELEDEDSNICKIITPHNSNYGSGFASDNSSSSIHIHTSSSCSHEIKLVNQQQQQQIPKKKLKIIGKLITKMRIAAEKPFWSIDNHF
jgi:hypothetical protein